MLTYDFSERGNTSKYEFLYRKIREDILAGRLSYPEKLPSKRGLAEHLKISVKTVENAYGQLELEGYIQTREKSGYYISRLSRSRESGPLPADFLPDFTQEEYAVDLTTNNIDYGRFPFSLWAKVMRETLADYDTSLLKTVPFNGVERLREEIAAYLYRYRGMRVSPNHIIIGAGTEYLYSRLTQLLGERAEYATENPGYRKIAKIYESAKVPWQYVDIDEHGLDVDALARTNANVVHVSPGHHFPVGMVMPVGRRQQLLDWAAGEPNRYIVEDDYDCEFRFSGKPVPAMQSMDRHHRVIYLNTFSKTMVPSLRISYMVLPRKLMERYVDTMSFYSCTVSGFEQYAMASFMEKGHFERHINRMTQHYKKQRELVLLAFRESSLYGRSKIVEMDAGNHFLLQINTALNDVEIKWAAKERGILLSCLSEYCFANPEKYQGYLIINYSNVSEKQIRHTVEVLEEIL